MNSVRNTASNPPCFWAMALNIIKLRWPDLDSNFQLNDIGGRNAIERIKNLNVDFLNLKLFQLC